MAANMRMQPDLDAPRGVSLSTVPRVTIGLPVYNGAATLVDTVRSLLSQTFDDVELLISDNASTDGTRGVVEELARTDARIRYVRQSINIGANGNYSFVAKEARGEFIKWSSASDLCAPTYIERCVHALDATPDAVLAAPRTRMFAGSIEDARDYDGDIEILGGTPLERLMHMHSRLSYNNSFNGLIRLSALRQTRLVEPYMGADVVLMGHLALLGKFLLVDEPLFYRRMEVATSTSLQSSEERLRHHYPSVTARTLLQTWKQHLGWLRAGAAAPMDMGERRRVLSYLVIRVIKDRALARELRDALRYLARRPTRDVGYDT